MAFAVNGKTLDPLFGTAGGYPKVQCIAIAV